MCTYVFVYSSFPERSYRKQLFVCVRMSVRICSYICSIYVRISSVYGRSIREPEILYVHNRMCTYVIRIRTYNVCIMQLYKHIRTYTNAHTNTYKQYTDGTSASVYVRILYVYVLKIRTYMTCIYKGPKFVNSIYERIRNSRKLFIYVPMAEAAAETEQQQHTAVWQQRPAVERVHKVFHS